MLSFSRKPLGIWLVTAFVLGASFLSSLLISHTAYAVMTGTWIDKATIRIGTNPDFKGPSTEQLPYGPYGQPANFQVFNGTGGVLKVYFGATENLDTAKTATYINTQQGTASMQQVNLTNTRSSVAAPSTSTGGTTSGTTSGTTTTAADTCKIDNIGWIVCPVASFLGKITDGAYAFVENFLVFQISKDPFSTDPAVNPAYTIWANIRTLANVLFIFAFFAIIFSQATSIGLSSYGIKRMLPRLVVAAILVNLSYYLCVLAVDVSNIIGAGLDGLIKSVPLSHLPKDGDGTWEKITSGILAGVVGGVALGIALYAALGFVLGFMVTALLALVTALVVLVARQALLIMLIVLSPLAFVAYILPNTEDLFNKWRKLFTALLVMYPLVAMIFAGSKVASEIMRITSPGGVTGVIIQIVSLGVLAIPLFALPFILKFSGGVLGRLGGMINDRNKGLIDRARNRGDQSSKARLAERRRRLYGKDTPDFSGKKFGRTRKALYGVASSSGRAKSAVDRKNRLANAEANEQRAATNYYAGRASTDAKYANRMAGGSNLPGVMGRTAETGDLARVVGRANEAIIKLNNEEIGAHNLSLNRNGATLAAEGISISSDGSTLYDRAGAPMTFAAASAAAKIPLDASGRFDAETIEALKYASNNRLNTTSNGAKALASTLAATGNLTADNAKALVENVQGANPQDKSFITAHINAEASKAGLKHLSYNTVDVNGKFQLGGQFGGVTGAKVDTAGNPIPPEIYVKEGVVGRLMQNGASTITKEMYSDKTFGPELAQAVTVLESQSPDTFETELVKMDPRKIENMVKAKLEAGLAATYPNYSTMSSDDQRIAREDLGRVYTKRREDAVQKYGLAS